MVARVFPVIAGQIVGGFGGVSHAAPVMSSVFVIGLVATWLVPEKTGRPLPA